jgi:hypothetical protein
MYPNTLPVKRSMSPLQSTSSSEMKRKKTNCDDPPLPTLRVDCTVPLRPLPQPVMYPSPLPQMEPCLPYLSAITSPTKIAEHQSFIQQSATYHSWSQYSGSPEVHWPTTNITYTTGTEFVGLCETSIASSVSLFSSISSAQNPFRDPPNLSNGCLQSPSVETVEVTRDMFIASMVPALTKLSDSLAEAKQVIGDLHKIASLLLVRGGH